MPKRRRPNTRMSILKFGHGLMLRYTDPERFGAILWLGASFKEHPLIEKIGPEPLSDTFNGEYLMTKAEGKAPARLKPLSWINRWLPVRGNIYATRALFLAGIYPEAPVGQISLEQFASLCHHIKVILHAPLSWAG